MTAAPCLKSIHTARSEMASKAPELRIASVSALVRSCDGDPWKFQVGTRNTSVGEVLDFAHCPTAFHSDNHSPAWILLTALRAVTIKKPVTTIAPTQNFS